MLTGQKPVAIHLSLPSFLSKGELVILSQYAKRTSGVPCVHRLFMLGFDEGGSRGFDGHVQG